MLRAVNLTVYIATDNMREAILETPDGALWLNELYARYTGPLSDILPHGRPRNLFGAHWHSQFTSVARTLGCSQVGLRQGWPKHDRRMGGLFYVDRSGCRRAFWRELRSDPDHRSPARDAYRLNSCTDRALGWAFLHRISYFGHISTIWAQQKFSFRP